MDKLVLRKTTKIAATRWHILKLKCTKYDFGWGSAPYPAGRAYSAPPEPLAVLNGGLRLRGRGGREEEEKDGRGRASSSPDFQIPIKRSTIWLVTGLLQVLYRVAQIKISQQ